MHIELSEKPRDVTIVEGFPGFGLVSTISTEFLVEHLDAKPIGKIWSEKLFPLVAIHNSKIVQPLEVFYVKSKNLIILHAISNIKGLEWEISEMIIELAKEVKAKEIISLEGVGAVDGKGEAFFYSNINKDGLSKLGITPLKEGIVVGVTGALLLKQDEIPLSCIFVETQSGLPDSKAAAKIIEILDKYLNLGVDYKPLLKMAKQFEGKIKNIIDQSNKVRVDSDKKILHYLG